nr:uncharacterized protein LOC122270116 [Parasteatoda tepidariorum]
MTPSYHAGSIHVSKCTGVKAKPDLPFKCNECPNLSFGSKRGLTQHQRHRHPSTLNAGRLEQEERKRARSSGGRVWSTAEELLFWTLEKKHHWDRRTLLGRLKEVFPDKTERQIVDKRKALREKNREGTLSASLPNILASQEPIANGTPPAASTEELDVPTTLGDTDTFLREVSENTVTHKGTCAHIGADRFGRRDWKWVVKDTRSLVARMLLLQPPKKPGRSRPPGLKVKGRANNKHSSRRAERFRGFQQLFNGKSSSVCVGWSHNHRLAA